MSETLHNGDTNVLEREDHTTESDNSYSETIEDWFRPLYDLVVANADVIIRCPWMGGTEVPLSKSMWSHSEVTPDSIDQVILEVQQLLADRVTEAEEPDEEEKLEEEPAKEEEAAQESNAETETQNEQGNFNTTDDERQVEKEIDGAEYSEFSDNTAEKTSEHDSVISAEVEVADNLVQSESNQFTGSATTKTEAAAISSDSSADRTSGDGLSVSEALTVTSSTSESSAQESVIDRTGQESTLPVSPAKDQLNETKNVIKLEVEPEHQIAASEIPEADAAEQQREVVTLPAAIEAITEAEPTELPPFESAAVLDDTTELSDEKIDVAEDESVPASFDYQTGTNSLADFVEEEVIMNHHEETDPETDKLYEFSNLSALEVVEESVEAGEETSISQLGDGSRHSEQMEIISPEQVVQTSSTIEEIEESLIQLTERIEASEPETIEKVNEILDKIIEVPAKFEAHDDKSIITQAQAQEELEELFTELLDKTGIDYTPELTESLAKLTLKCYLTEEIEKLKNEVPDEEPQDSGTHEIIKKLLVALGTIKKAVAHAGAIGRSAIQLYSFNLASFTKLSLWFGERSQAF